MQDSGIYNKDFSIVCVLDVLGSTTKQVPGVRCAVVSVPLGKPLHPTVASLRILLQLHPEKRKFGLFSSSYRINVIASQQSTVDLSR